VIEIPESAVTDVTAMADLRSALNNLGVEFAYDDFGTGQTRLLEMTAVPPHYLKFDKTIIQGIETEPARQEMVAALVRIADTLRTRVIAEGIETPETVAVCRQLGCPFGQGFLLAPPASAFPRDVVIANDEPPTIASAAHSENYVASQPRRRKKRRSS
jgi:EAL domain-containing protein (putative c-di-GMP-specific phosphodiesterase class I)